MRDLPWISRPGAAFPARHARAQAEQTGPLPWSRWAPLIAGFGLLAADLAAFAAAAAAAVVLRDTVRGPSLYPVGLLQTGAVWVALRFIGALYPGFGLSPVEELQRSTSTTVVAALAHAAMLFGLKAADASRFIVLVTWCLAIPISGAAREAIRKALIRLGQFGAPVVIAGAGQTGERLLSELRENPGLGLVPVAFFDDHPATHGRRIGGVPVLGRVEDALAVPRPVRHALIAIPSLPGHRLARLARTLSARYQHVGVVGDLSGFVDLSLRPRSLGSCMALEVHNRLLDPVSRVLKRAFDLLVAAPLGLLALPAVIAAGIAVKIASPGPALFAQEREGRGGRRIRVLKIRTMVPDAEELLARHLAENDDARAEWMQHMKLRRDPRVIPRVGYVVRRSCLDELPQLWNVVKGEMSLVGPRPFPEYHLNQFPPEFRDLRRQASPGMTGLWQVTCRSDGDLRAQEEADTYYIRNWSLWTDLWVLLRTMRAVVAGRGAC